MPFSEHPQFQDFVSYLTIKNIAERTIEEYTKVLRDLFRYLNLGEAPPGSVTSEQLSDYLHAQREKELASKTIADRVIILKRFFGFLLGEGQITVDPSRRIPHPRVGQRLPKALSLSEVKQLFATFDETTPLGRRDKMFFLLAYAGGLRISEGTHLRVEDADWSEGQLRVVGKGDKERRVYLKPEVLRALQAYIAEFQIKDYLFPGRRGQPVTLRNMDMRFEVYVEKAGLPQWVTPHSLRHSIAVHYLLGGAPISFVQDLLGHAKLGTTGIYTRLADPMMREIVLRIPTALDVDEGKERKLQEGKAACVGAVKYWDEFVMNPRLKVVGLSLPLPKVVLSGARRTAA